MNWSLGLFRPWLVLSALYVVAIALLVLLVTGRTDLFLSGVSKKQCLVPLDDLDLQKLQII